MREKDMITPAVSTDILLVDDVPENIISLEALLEAPGLNFIRAHSGEEALNATISSRPALILMDVQMPNMNGFEVARMLRSTERTRSIPIIFVTATHREEKFSFQGFEAGAVDYLYKPLDPTVVRSKVKVFVELHRNKLSLETAVRDLSMMNSELESFSYSVSHDLRAPLRSILGFTSNVLDNGEHSPENAEMLKRVIAAGNRMNQLIESLLGLAHVTVATIEKREVNLSALAAQICKECELENQDRRFKFSIAENLVAAGDKSLLENVLRNLLSNAVKFTSKKELAYIEFGMKRERGNRVYFVRDNGAGFDAKYADKLFGAFQRLHGENEFPGTGVGLATVQRIIHRHGGRIWAESTLGQSTTFFFTLENKGMS